MSAQGLPPRPVSVRALLSDDAVDETPRRPRPLPGVPTGDGARRRRDLPRRLPAAIALAAVVVAAAGVAVVGWEAAHPVQVRTVVRSAPPAGAPTAAWTGRQVAAAVAPSVVSITARGMTQTEAGTGIVIGSDGTVLTNNHVIANVATNGGSISLLLPDGGTAVAYVVGRDQQQDVAVLRAVGETGLRPATLASSATLHLGDPLWAVGQFLGFPGTVTSGIVSGLHRTITARSGETTTPEDQLFGVRPSLPTVVTLTDVIQTDVDIGPGNSGGPLVDDHGRVVGVNTACPANGSGGPGFAIPIERAYRVAQRLLR